MAEGKPVQSVWLEVGADRGQAWIKISTAGASPITIPIDPQAAFECAEKLARAAHTAKFGEPPQSDESYIRDQIRARVTDNIRDRMTNRVSLMLNTLREDKRHNNRALAQLLVETILQKVV